MKTKQYIIPLLIVTCVSQAATFTWEHQKKEHTTKYVLYKQIGEQDPVSEMGLFIGETDDLPVGTTPAGGELVMNDVPIEPLAVYYLRAENEMFVSGPSNSIRVEGIPAGVTGLKITVTINIETTSEQ